MERDLGIWVSSDLKWETKCKKAAAQAMSVLGMIRTFPFVDVDGFKLLFNVYIRPHLEFCVQDWLPYLKKTLTVRRKCSVGQQKGL